MVIKLDVATKKKMEEVCSSLGITVEKAFILFAEKVAAEKRLPFDAFYSYENIKYLEGIQQNIRDGKAHFEEHNLIDD